MYSEFILSEDLDMQKTIVGILLICLILLSGCKRTYRVDYSKRYKEQLTEQLGVWKVVNTYEHEFENNGIARGYTAKFWVVEYTDYRGNTCELIIRNDLDIYYLLWDYMESVLDKEFENRISDLDDGAISPYGYIDYYIDGEEKIISFSKDRVGDSKKVLEHIIIKDCSFDTLTNYKDLTIQLQVSFHDELTNETERILAVWNKLTETLEESKVSLRVTWTIPDSDERYTGYLHYDNGIIINWERLDR